MKINIYLNASALENLARGETVNYWAISMTDAASEHQPTDGFRVAEGLEVPTPSRKEAAVIATRMLQVDAEMTAKCFRDRIANLQALEWEES